jgi:hypothetical protein
MVSVSIFLFSSEKLELALLSRSSRSKVGENQTIPDQLRQFWKRKNVGLCQWRGKVERIKAVRESETVGEREKENENNQY